MENGNWAYSFLGGFIGLWGGFFVCFIFGFGFVLLKNDWKATEDSLRTATALEGGGWWEPEFQILQFWCWKGISHSQLAQKTLPQIFVPGKHKAALWKCCRSLATSRVVWVCFLSPEHLIRCFTLEPPCRYAVVKHFSCWLKGVMSEKGVSYSLHWVFLYTK